MMSIKISKEDLESTKEFILWAKANGILAITIDKISVTFAPTLPKPIEFNLDELKRQEKEEESLMFYSSR